MAEVDGGDIIIRIRGDASELEAEIGRAQGALGDLGDSADDTSDGLGGMAGAAGTAGKAMQGMSRGGVNGLAMGLRQVNPALGTALMAFTGMKKALPGLNAGTISLSGATRGLSVALKGLVAALGPIGIGLLAGAAAYEAINFAASKYEDQLDELNKDLAESIKVNNQLNAALGGLDTMERQVADGLSLFRGEITQTELEIRKFNIQADAQTAKLINAAKAAKVSDEQTARNVEGIKARAAALKESNRELQELEAAQTTATATTETITKAFDAEEQRLLDVARAARVAQDALNALGRSQQQEAQNRSIERIEQETEIEHFNRTNADREKKHADDTARLAAETRDKRVSFAKDANQQIGQTTAAFASVMADKHKKASLIAYRVSQASGIAEATISTAKGVAKAMELGPIFGPPAAVLMGALGAMQVATIAAVPPPTAHIGTGMPGSRDPLAPDERMSSGRRVLTTEASGPGGVVNSMGTQLLNDVNTGRVQSTGRITAVIGRSHLDQELFRSGRRGTSRYARSLRTNPHPKPQGGY